jgi:hypothetical protein
LKNAISSLARAEFSGALVSGFLSVLNS